MQNRPANLLFIFAVFLLIFIALFLLRSTDDNRLFSWEWAFAGIEASKIYLLLAAGLIISLFLSCTAVPENYHIPFLSVLSFAAVVPFWTEPELIVDASRYFTQAKHLELYGAGYFLKEWGKTIQAWTDLPLVPFLYGLVFKLSGESRTAVQLFTTTLFSLTTVLTYLTGKALWDRETGFSAGLLLLGIPYLLTQVPLMLVDVPTMCFLTLSIFTFLDALDRGGPARISFAVAAIVCTVLSKYSAWFMLSVLGMALIVYVVRSVKMKDRGPVLRGVVILLFAAAVSGAILLLKLGVVSEQIALLREFQKPGLDRWKESFVSTFLFQVHPIITVSALVSLVTAVRKRDAKYLIICWLPLLIFLFGVRRIRYIVPLFPMLVLMAAYGLQVIKQDRIRRFVVFGTVMSSLVIALFAYLPLAKSMSAVNLKHAGECLNTLQGEEVEVITVAPKDSVVNAAVSVPLLDLFTDKRIRYDYRAGSFPSRDEIERSSLRFTWEYRNPDYYSARSDSFLNGKFNSRVNVNIAVITDASDGPLPEAVSRRLDDSRLTAAFCANEGIFQYTVGVRIYQKTNSPPARTRR